MGVDAAAVVATSSLMQHQVHTSSHSSIEADAVVEVVVEGTNNPINHMVAGRFRRQGRVQGRLVAILQVAAGFRLRLVQRPALPSHPLRHLGADTPLELQVSAASAWPGSRPRQPHPRTLGSFMLRHPVPVHRAAARLHLSRPPLHHLASSQRSPDSQCRQVPRSQVEWAGCSCSPTQQQLPPRPRSQSRVCAPRHLQQHRTSQAALSPTIKPQSQRHRR